MLKGGVLNHCFEKVRQNYYNGISADVHAERYERTERPLSYAEPEFTGKYLDLCATYYEDEGDERALANGMKVVESIERNMREDGYIGCLPEGEELKHFSVWNHGFTLYGLTRMLEATGDERILTLVKRAADWLCQVYADPAQPDILDATNAGSQNISCLFAMGRAYRATGDERYAAFLRKVLAYCETTDMNLLSFENVLQMMSRKGIEMLVIYLGVLQFGQLCNEPKAIQAAQRYWQQIWETQIRNTGNGTMGELWTEGGNQPKLMATEERPNETCVAVGWMELSLALFYQEQRAYYLDAIEQTLFNHLVGSLKQDGADIAYYQGNFGKKNFRTGEGWYQCCRYRGFTMFTNLPRIMNWFDGSTFIPIAYGSGEYRAEGLTVIQETNYPSDGRIHFAVDSNALRTIKLRIPRWCEAWSLSVNGANVDAQAQDGFVCVALAEGHTEMVLTLEMAFRREEHIIHETPLDMEGKELPMDHREAWELVKAQLAKRRKEDRDYLCFHYGPLLLAQDTRFGQPLWTEVAPDAPLALAAPVERSLVHVLCGDMHLVDFASAGSNDPGKDEYTVFVPMKKEDKQ